MCWWYEIWNVCYKSYKRENINWFVCISCSFLIYHDIIMLMFILMLMLIMSWMWHSLCLLFVTSGDAITFITVGGRTSAVVLKHQKKTLKLTLPQNQKKSRSQNAPLATKVIKKKKTQKKNQKDTTVTHSSTVLPTHVEVDTMDKQKNSSVKKSNQKSKFSSLDVPLLHSVTTRSRKRKASGQEEYRNT